PDRCMAWLAAAVPDRAAMPRHGACVADAATRTQPGPGRSNIGHHRSSTMKPTDLFNDLQNKVSEALRNSPAKDIEKNVRSMMTQGFARLDLVTREEFDVQSQVLARTRARLEELETRVAALEARAGIGAPPSTGA